ncbi:MAG: PQQ-binding-like beta-propeller repeat protein, partial [Desulfobacteraceae bacterium]|nr:PQQ-binding-like beta-propeller repeat protein [Desulfobacteraceae bacterium]
CSDQPVHFAEKPGRPDCPEVQAGIWARAGVVYDQGTDRIFTATGNGTFAPRAFDWGDTVLALRPDGSGAAGGPLDSYTPTDHQLLQIADKDLGSTAPAILPVPPGGRIAHLAVQGGKDDTLRLLDLDNLSGRGGPGQAGGEIGRAIAVPQGGEVLTAPAVWVRPGDRSTWVFIANDRGISGLRLVNENGLPALETEWKRPHGGTSPLVANGVLFYAGSGGIRALDPETGKQLWGERIGSIHWQSPIVADGVLYVPDEDGTLTAFSIPGAAPLPR